MFRFEQVKPLTNCDQKVISRRKPTLKFDQVCECGSSEGVEAICGKMIKGCRLTTKAIKPFPFPKKPLTTYEEITQNPDNSTEEFVKEMKKKVQSVLIESPKSIHVKQLLQTLQNQDTTKNNHCVFKPKKTRPVRLLTNEEITNKIWRRKLMREKKCGDRLGPYTQVDQAIFNTDIFALCKGDRFKSCIQKKKQNEAEEVAVRKEYKELEVQTDETYIEQMKSAMVTKETLLEDEMNKLREERNKKEEKKRLKKLKKNASLTVIDWNVKPNPCKALLNPDGTCPEKDVNDSDEDSDDEKIECTCHKSFKYCLAMDFLRRKDYQHNWMPSIKCAEPEPKKADKED